MKAKELVPVSSEPISLLELKLLAKSIVHKHARVKIKCLTEGGKWTREFFTVLMVTERGLVLNDDHNDKIKSISLLDQVLQFIIDRPFDSYQPGLAYIVR